MLPDFPEIKAHCERVLLKRAQAEKRNAMGFLSEISEVAVFEGNRLLTVRDDGSEFLSSFKTVESLHKMSCEQAEQLTLDELEAQFSEMGATFAEQQSRHIFTVIDETIEETGNLVERETDEPLVEVFFRMLEKAELSFDKQGKPEFQLVCGASMVEKLQALDKEIKGRPDLMKRHQKIMEHKMEQWRDRESDRQLVE